MSHGRQGQRAVARPHPQEVVGPRLRVHPQRRLSARALLLGAAVMAFVVLAGAVAIQAQRIETQRTIDRLELELVSAEAEQRHLRASVAAAASPARILAAAAELDLMEPAAVVPLTPIAPVAPELVAPPEAPAPVPADAAPVDPADLAQGAGASSQVPDGEGEG